MSDIETDIICQFDIIGRVWTLFNSLRYGSRRQRKHHKLTGQLRGVAGIEFVAGDLSGFATLDLLRHYGIPAWAGAVLGTEKDTGNSALRLHCPASQVRFARYILARRGIRLLDGAQPVIAASTDSVPTGSVPQQRPMRAWADGAPPAPAKSKRKRGGWFGL